jgi:hypothetical protein
VNHKTQEQNDFYEILDNLFGDYEDYHFLGFHVMWSERGTLLKGLLPPSSRQEMVFPKPHKVMQSSG